MQGTRFAVNEAGLAELAEDYEVENDLDAMLLLTAAIQGDTRSREPVITGPCDIAADALTNGEGYTDCYRILIHPSSAPGDPWIAGNAESVFDGELPADAEEIIRDAVEQANKLLAWNER
jgi:hypothetical protein